MARESITAGSTAGGTRRAATHYGRRLEEGANVSVYHVDGNVFRQETTFKFDELPVAALDQLHQRVPVGARVLGFTVKVHDAFTSTSGTTTLAFGLQQEDGTEIDNDGLVTATAVDANFTAGAFIDGAGALVGAGSGLAAAGQIVATASVADLLTGEATIVLEYEVADDRKQAMNG